MRTILPALLGLTLVTAPVTAQSTTSPSSRFEPMDVFGLELGADPRISPDGQQVVFVRTYFDALTDARRSNLWILPYGGGEARPLTTGGQRDASPRWSPDGRMVAYVSNEEEGSQVWLRWMDTGETAKLTSLTESPGGLTWSPDGRWLAFTMFVPEEDPPLSVDMPKRPEGAEWGPSWTYIDELTYRSDGSGYIRPGHRHLFVLPVEGGTPRQVTRGPFDHGAPSWTADGRALVFSANRHEDRERVPRNSELWRLDIETGALVQLTDRFGPDADPAVSPDGRRIAFTGYDDAFQGYQTTRLYVMDADGSNRRELAAELDRSLDNPVWSADGRGLYVDYDSEGVGRLAFVELNGRVTELVNRVGGMSLGRPYSGGSWSVASNGRFAFTRSAPDRPAEVAVGERRRPGQARTITDLNADVLAHKELGEVEEIWYASSHDDRRIQGWIIRPPGFDPSRKYPLVLEIHGGPFAAYGPVFAAELQLYAAAGYVVLYTNPRGSTSYGQEFGNLIHHAYPSQDYDDLISGVDAVIARGYVDPDRLFVTGGSGGGVLSAWIVGKTDRFRAAVVQKPVINWYSFVLYADNPATFYRYWFPGPPWEHMEHYMARSPLSLVGNVDTPTMLITGEEDFRTPIPESEQYYAALQIRGVPSALVRVPDAGHGIASKPSNLIEKVAYVLGWFAKWDAASRPATE